MNRLYTFGASMALLSAFGMPALAEQTAIDYINVDPADGATVKTLSQIVVTLPCVDDSYETQLTPDMEALSKLAVTKDGKTVATFGEIGEPNGDDYGNVIFPIILSETISAEGEYSFTLPEGAFAQMGWDDAADDFVIVDNGMMMSVYTATITVDPNAKTPVDNYVLTPASGSTLDEISKVSIAFPEISLGIMFDSWMFPNATFTNGDTTVEAIVGYDWNNEEDYLVMNISPIDSDEEFISITDAGKWTLTIEAGTFALNGNRSSEITAEYNIGSASEVEIVDFVKVTPADGDTVKTLSQVEFSLPLFDEDYATLPAPDESKLADAKVTKDGETVATFVEPGEMSMKGELYFVMPLILSDVITEAGEYTISLPEGFFRQMIWDEDAESYVPVKDGKISAAYTATVTIDPSMKTIVDDYTLSPADGETVNDLTAVYVSFPQIALGTYFTNWEFPNATFTDGTNTFEGVISYDWNNEEDYLVMKVTPVDADEEPATISTKGSWTLTIEEGTFNFKGDSNAEIKATYNVIGESGIDSVIGNENGNVTAISIDGKVVLNNAPASELNSLDKGIYVINGKKVVLK